VHRASSRSATPDGSACNIETSVRVDVDRLQDENTRTGSARRAGVGRSTDGRVARRSRATTPCTRAARRRKTVSVASADAWCSTGQKSGASSRSVSAWNGVNTLRTISPPRGSAGAGRDALVLAVAVASGNRNVASPDPTRRRATFERDREVTLNSSGLVPPAETRRNSVAVAIATRVGWTHTHHSRSGNSRPSSTASSIGVRRPRLSDIQPRRILRSRLEHRRLGSSRRDTHARRTFRCPRSRAARASEPVGVGASRRRSRRTRRHVGSGCGEHVDRIRLRAAPRNVRECRTRCLERRLAPTQSPR
jgi:hypothetical protein